jgi:hypothetical protein
MVPDPLTGPKLSYGSASADNAGLPLGMPLNSSTPGLYMRRTLGISVGKSRGNDRPFGDHVDRPAHPVYLHQLWVCGVLQIGQLDTRNAEAILDDRARDPLRATTIEGWKVRVFQRLSTSCRCEYVVSIASAQPLRTTR